MLGKSISESEPFRFFRLRLFQGFWHTKKAKVSMKIPATDSLHFQLTQTVVCELKDILDTDVSDKLISFTIHKNCLVNQKHTQNFLNSKMIQQIIPLTFNSSIPLSTSQKHFSSLTGKYSASAWKNWSSQMYPYWLSPSVPTWIAHSTVWTY